MPLSVGEEGDLISLGVDFDSAAWSQLQTALGITADKVETASALMNALAENSLKAVDGFSQLTLQSSQGMDNLNGRIRITSSEIAALQEEVDQLSKILALPMAPPSSLPEQGFFNLPSVADALPGLKDETEGLQAAFEAAFHSGQDQAEKFSLQLADLDAQLQGITADTNQYQELLAQIKTANAPEMVPYLGGQVTGTYDALREDLFNPASSNNAAADNGEFDAARQRVQSAHDEMAAEQEFLDKLKEVQSVRKELDVEANDVEFETARQRIQSIHDEMDAEQEFLDKLKEAQSFREELASESTPTRLQAFQSDRLSQFEGQTPSVDEMANGLDDGGDGGGSGGGGSLFGIGHAMSVAGHSLGSPALREAGGLIYVEEGLKQVLPLFDQLNDKLVETPSALSPLIGGLTELGVPLAGLLAVGLPLIGAIAGVAVALSTFFKIIQDGANEVKQASDKQVEYFTFAATHTSDDAKARLSTDQAIVDANAKAMGNLKELIANRLKETGTDYDDKDIADTLNPQGPSKGVLRQIAVDTDPFGPLRGLYDQYDKLSAASAKTGADMDALTNGIKNGDFAANDAAAATIKRAQQDSDFAHQLIRDNEISVEQGNKRLEGLRQEGPVIQDQMNALKPYIATNEEARQKYAELDNQLKNTREEIQYLTHTAIPNAQAIKDAADASKEAEKAFKDQAKTVHDALLDIGKAVDDFGKQTRAAEDTLRTQTAEAKTREANAEQQYKSGSLQDTFERKKIDTTEDRKEDALALDSANKLADIRAKAGEKEQQIGLDLARQYQDDQIKYNTDLQKLREGAGQQEQQDLSDHLARLADIRQSSELDERMALLNRNFLQAYQIGLREQQATTKEDTSYTDREGKLQQHLSQQEADLQRAMIIEGNHQQLAAARKIADEDRAETLEIEHQQTADQRKLATMRLAEQQQLQDLTSTENYKLQLLHKGLQEELSLLDYQEKQRIAIITRTEGELIGKAVQNLLSNPILQFVGGAVNGLLGQAAPPASTSAGGNVYHMNFTGGTTADMFNTAIQVARSIFHK